MSHHKMDERIISMCYTSCVHSFFSSMYHAYRYFLLLITTRFLFKQMDPFFSSTYKQFPFSAPYSAEIKSEIRKEIRIPVPTLRINTTHPNVAEMPSLHFRLFQNSRSAELRMTSTDPALCTRAPATGPSSPRTASRTAAKFRIMEKERFRRITFIICRERRSRKGR